MIKRALNILGLAVGLVVVVVAAPHTLQGIALLLAGLVLVGGNIYWLLTRRRTQRLAALNGGEDHAAAND